LPSTHLWCVLYKGVETPPPKNLRRAAQLKRASGKEQQCCERPLYRQSKRARRVERRVLGKCTVGDFEAWFFISRCRHGHGRPVSSTAVERTWRTYDSQDQILVLPFRKILRSSPSPSAVFVHTMRSQRLFRNARHPFSIPGLNARQPSSIPGLSNNIIHLPSMPPPPPPLLSSRTHPPLALNLPHRSAGVT
jgi:hypothetical protein